MYESTRCPGCGNDLEETSKPGSAWLVDQHVCQACAAVEIVRRDAHTAHAKDKPRHGHKAHFDGRVFYARPHTTTTTDAEG